MRVWANHFAPLGTPLIDAEGAAESIDNVLEALAHPNSGLPQVLVIPDLKINRPAAQLIRAIAMSRNLPLAMVDERLRPMLESLLDGEAYLSTVSSKHNHEMRRQWRKLSEKGEVAYNVARQPRDIVKRMEEFLLLESSGWKGKEKTALTIDRLRSAFAREAIYNLASADKVRIHTIDLDGRAIASLVVFMSGGEAYTWKTAYNEAYASCSPGKILMSKVTEWHLDDANIVRTDSLAVPDHPVMSRLWRERETMATLIVGLTPTATVTCARSPRSSTFTRTPATSPASCATGSCRCAGAADQARALSSRRMILPVVVIGKASRNSISRGYSCIESRCLTQSRICTASSAVAE